MAAVDETSVFILVLGLPQVATFCDGGGDTGDEIMSFSRNTESPSPAAFGDNGDSVVDDGQDVVGHVTGDNGDVGDDVSVPFGFLASRGREPLVLILIVKK